MLNWYFTYDYKTPFWWRSSKTTILHYGTVPTKLPFGIVLAPIFGNAQNPLKTPKKMWLVLPSFSLGLFPPPENQHDNGTKTTIYHLFLCKSPTRKPQIFLSLPCSCCHVSLEVFFTMPPEKNHLFVTRSALCQPNLRKSWFASSASEP